jgi:glutaconate CoA-transferase subunit B
VSVEDARQATGWELRVADGVETGDPPTAEELQVLRSLKTIEEDVKA